MKNSATISTAIWFDNQAKEAMTFYATIFPNSKLNQSNDIVTDAIIGGIQFTGINGGPIFRPNPSISFMVILENKEDVDAIWAQLSSGGKVLMELDQYPWSQHYGWIEDRYGVSWQLYLGKLSDVSDQQIVPTIMFTQDQNGKCEEALSYYELIFSNFSSHGILKYKEGEQSGLVQHTQFAINNFLLMAMDGGNTHDFKFNEGISLVVHCDNQEDIDYYWNRLTKEGEESMCGWCKDKYGISWQVIPKGIEKMIQSPSASSALMKMHKIIIDDLK